MHSFVHGPSPPTCTAPHHEPTALLWPLQSAATDHLPKTLSPVGHRRVTARPNGSAVCDAEGGEVLSTYPLLGDGLLPMALATGPSPQSTSRHRSVNGGSPDMALWSLGGCTAVHAAPQPLQPQRYRPRSLNAVAVCTSREHGRVTVCVGGGVVCLAPRPRPSSENENGEAQRVRFLPLTHPLIQTPACHVRRGRNHPGWRGGGVRTPRRTRSRPRGWAPPERHTTCVCQP